MNINFKYYPRKRIRIKDIVPLISNNVQINIIDNTQLWLNGKISYASEDISFLFTENGSFSFSIKKLDVEVMKYMKELLVEIGYSCFNEISIKIYFDHNLKITEFGELKKNILAKLEEIFKIDDIQLNISSSDVDIDNIAIKLTEKCYFLEN